MASGNLPGQMPEPQEILEFLKGRYMLQGMGEAGQPATPSAWDAFKEHVGHDAEKIQVAAQAIKHFIDNGQRFLAQHQPVNMHYLASGMGMELAGGFQVSFVAAHLGQGNVGMEPAGDIPVTLPRSQVGQHGIAPSHAIGVTGVAPEPYQYGQQPPPPVQQPQQPQPAATADPNDPLA